MRVLVVEDEEQLADAVARGLRLHAIAVDVAYDGREALELASYVGYDVVVLDRDLPDVHGDEVCRELVTASGASRILMLTAAGRVRDRVGGLALGADDYLVKPFVFAELVARVRALARRAPGPRRRCWSVPGSGSTRPAVRWPGTGGRWRWAAASSTCCRS